jgi:hypothetical protein
MQERGRCLLDWPDHFFQESLRLAPPPAQESAVMLED